MTSYRKSKVYFFFENPVTLKDRNRLKNFIESVFKQESQSLKTLNYIFCSDQRLLEINKQYLNHDYYTDIITFDLAEKNLPTEGEIYISVPRVTENAKNLNESLKRELHRVIFHGALHLCGFKDKTQADQKQIRKKEDFYLAKYFR